MKNISYALAILFATCAPTSAQTGLIGTWRAESTPPGTTWTAVLRVDGPRLTGAVTSCSSNSAEIRIYEGHIDGNAITFKCDSLNGVRTMTFTGTINGDEIAFSWEKLVQNGGTPSAKDDGMFGPSAPTRFTAKRVSDGALAEAFDRVAGVEFAAAVNLVEHDLKGEGVLFLPQNVSRVRAVVVVIFWGLNRSAIYGDAQWRKLAGTLELGLLSARISYMSEPNASIGLPGGIPATGGADTLVTLLRRFAEESGHPELTRAPLLFWGYSAAGGQVSGLAGALPHRTIAFVRYHSANAAYGDMKVLSQIPALSLVGQKDNHVLAETIWKTGRSARAPWTFAVDPTDTHARPELQKANGVMIPWITAVLSQRLSPDDATLRAVTDGSAWMGNNQTGAVAPYTTFPGSKPEASWLPDEPSARAWRVVVGAAK